MEQRYLPIHDMEVRKDDERNEAHVCGYFAVFDSEYAFAPGVTESIAPGAFDDSASGDVRALWNHNTDIILGRTSAGTFQIKQDSRGLWGDITLNLNDTDANNAYQRISRGDVSGCSFGFEIESQEIEYRDDESVHFRITKVNPLYECSPCVFPAYQATNISARHEADLAEIRAHKLEAVKAELLAKLKEA